jgi:shikimate dehydrogenase
MKIYGLIGKTLGHSFSQKYFSEKFQKEHITGCQYRNFELTDLAWEIPGLKSNPELSGLNVTIPYKRDILPFLDDLTPDCREIGACNCIYIRGGKWTGYNTDASGFREALIPHLSPSLKKALILGTGGASHAVAFVMKELGIDFLKVSRRTGPPDSVIRYGDITPDLMDEYRIIINTTPLGTYPDMAQCPPLPYQYLTPGHFCFDLIYNPARTLFLSLSEARGAAIENGEKMLSLQAEESWKIWNR